MAEFRGEKPERRNYMMTGSSVMVTLWKPF